MTMFQNRPNKLLMGCAALLVGGCAPTYVKPVDGPTAKLRVVSENSEGYYAFTKVASESCKGAMPNFPIIGAGSKPDAEHVGMPGQSAPASDRFETVIPAQKPFRVAVFTLRRVGAEGLLATTPIGADDIRKKDWSCRGVSGFTPEVNHNYEMRYHFLPGDCSVTVDDLSTVDGNVVRKAVPVNYDNGACKWSGGANLGPGTDGVKRLGQVRATSSRSSDATE